MKMNRLVILISAFVAQLALAQQSDILIKLTQGDRPVIAVPDFRGSGDAQQHMAAFNETLFRDLQDSGFLKMAAKSMYPLEVPQRPQDFRPPAGNPPRRTGPWLTDWSAAPVNANYLAAGYSAVQNGQLVLYGWLINVNQPDMANAQVFGKVYLGPLDAAGARKVAHEFAADILARFGAESLAGTKVYYTSERGKVKEIWVMDHEGSNQRQLSRLGSTSRDPMVSPDGTRIAFTTFAKGNPSIMVISSETGRQIPFYNQRASLNATPDFMPDGRIIYSSTAAGGFAQLYLANGDGSGLSRLTNTRAIDIHPRVNPKNPNELVFVSGRSGLPQIYKMNMDGTDVVRLTPGEGEAVQPAWHSNGQLIAFSWTKGFDPGNYNIFIMDVASKRIEQLTHGAGRNENPSWAPDGRHLVFSSTRSGSAQIWTMLADGTQIRQLTTQGRNENPVWSK
jgi:TolB protein